MTVAFFSGKARRAGVALGAVSAGLLVLSACGSKPTPIATVTVGSDSYNTEAAENCYDEGGLKESRVQECLSAKGGEEVEVSVDDRIRFGVDPEIAENGWTIFLDGERAEQEPYTKTYRSISASSFFAPGMGGQTSPNVRVALLETDAKTKKAIGVYRFVLKKV
ncbi:MULTISPECIES: hypothetical protein [Streptomyces]|uniref:DUF2771 domain-containing protein n=1 Tax=Streptomyces fradiae ATCC 10745 = DSM 40063 TaxID=1319510 RepID=A0A1Y2NZQ8_STRFR|nr:MULTISPECIES: hypothetical protein [Streptomyces]KAF0651060.1 hypothetical protein K701_04615 [Streptomyces fradiae ATCC 10745 = DSM 40063]OSY53052.1 hypothetical protein BG846_01318 [Streptomyces fradiae ATCC 10745 = DSM 40063]QEV12813.1 DUF2771 domain-containing protein [Streptomyces fradiae ATCC 10745 = DSM 40063]